ncbi:MAG: hypothetical protein C0418_06015 [Coriobacteriaceae bacterium]|nr:hypothetical protein [Coriobacteriaceae bacterium]
MILQMTRFVFFAAGSVGGFAVAGLIDWSEQIGYPQYLVIIIFVILGGSIGYLSGSIIGREATYAWQRFEERLQSLSAVEIMLGGLGGTLGILVAVAVSYPLRLLQPAWIGLLGSVAAFGLLSFIGLRVALLKAEDVSRAFPRLAAGAAAGVPGADDDVFLDTSAVIDGRFVDLRRAGFLPGRLRVPRFVLAELHTLSDSADDVRRARGRRGLDLLATLQQGDSAVEVFEIDYADIPEVDLKLVRLARDSGGSLLTVDHNLTDLARVRGVRALNVNELAAALRPSYLPGESLRVNVVREGKEPGQGVGYLEDGTMVVVAAGSDRVGESIETEVTSVLQTSAGRMIFAKLKQLT